MLCEISVVIVFWAKIHIFIPKFGQNSFFYSKKGRGGGGGHFGPTFIFPGKTVNFFGVNTLFHTKNEEKSQKISTCIRIHTRVYAITCWWG